MIRPGPDRHPSTEALARAAEGLLDPDTGAELEQHLTGCAACRAQHATLNRLGALLGASASPMPADVASRLRGVVTAEQRRREQLGGLTTAEASPSSPAEETRQVVTALPVGRGVDPAIPAHPYGTRARPHPGLGRFGADLRKVSAGRRWALPALAAAAVALVVGCGTYVLSATLGLNEPPSVAVAIGSGQLGPQAQALRQRTDLEPHRFSQAWWCARRVTDAPIVGLASIRSAGEPALLVYTRSGRGVQATVVRGCDRSEPQAGPSVLLGR